MVYFCGVSCARSLGWMMETVILEDIDLLGTRSQTGCRTRTVMGSLMSAGLR